MKMKSYVTSALVALVALTPSSCEERKLSNEDSQGLFDSHKSPVHHVSSAIPQFREQNTGLEQTLEGIIGKYRADGTIYTNRNGKSNNKWNKHENTSIAVLDLTSNTFIATINAETPRQLASEEKYLSAIAAMAKVEAGKLNYGPNMARNFEQSLHLSANGAANQIRSWADGPQAVTQYFIERGVPVDINSEIPPGGAEYNNKASAKSEARILWGLYNRKFPGSKTVLKYMKKTDRGDHNRLLKYTKIPGGCRFWNKTGTTGRHIGDSAIIEPYVNGVRRPYIVVVDVDLSDDSAKNGWKHAQRRLRQPITDISNAVYEHMKKRYK